MSKAHTLCLGLLVIVLVLINRRGMAEVTNPHSIDIQQYNGTCTRCHPGDPYADEGPTIVPEGLTQVCDACHKGIPLSCERAVTPEVTGILVEQIPSLVLTKHNGRLTCESCHLVHGNGIKRVYSIFLKQAERINPHSAGIFCIFCHNSEPREEGGPLDLKYDGDRVTVCTRCHNNERARADNHPVNISPSQGKGIQLDERFPLHQGKVTCVTCHDIRCQGGERNPKFLRGGPYEKRVDACLICHKRESYRAVNPHEQIDEQGKLKKDRCLYCHILDTTSQARE
ncbi:MAG: hypothetical protein ACMUIS_08645 [bacterium]